VGPAAVDVTSDTSGAIDGVMECLDNWSEDASTESCPRDYLKSISDKYLVETTLKEYLSSEVVWKLERS